VLKSPWLLPGGILLLALATPLRATGQSSRSNPSLESLKKQVTILKLGELGTSSKTLYFILDPELRNGRSHCYSPYDSRMMGKKPVKGKPYLLSLAESGVEELGALVASRDGGRELKAFEIVQDVMFDFFGHFLKNRLQKNSLDDLLLEMGGREKQSILLITVGARFWVRAHKGDRPATRTLESRIEIRAFKMKMVPITSGPTTLKHRADLTHCELLFQDAARGEIPLKLFRDNMAGAMKAVIIKAFLDQLAVNFSVNPSLRSAMINIESKKKGGITGRSISENR